MCEYFSTNCPKGFRAHNLFIHSFRHTPILWMPYVKFISSSSKCHTSPVYPNGLFCLYISASVLGWKNTEDAIIKFLRIKIQNYFYSTLESQMLSNIMKSFRFKPFSFFFLNFVNIFTLIILRRVEMAKCWQHCKL